MRIIITGGSGLLGSRIAELALARGADVDGDVGALEVYCGYAHNAPPFGKAVRLDLLDPSGLTDTIKKLEPDIVIHSAALTDVDRCEREKELAFRMNVEGTRAVAGAAEWAGSHLVYISTDYVFDGERGMYREDDPTNPVSYYGCSKLLGEQFCPSVARTCVIYGSRPASGKVNFALWLIESLKAGRQVRVVTDQFITPTLNTNLAEMLLEAAERRLDGIYHLAGADRISRYDYACSLARAFDLDESLILPSCMDEMKWNAKRPKDSSLDSSKAARTLLHKPLPLTEALRRLKDEMRLEMKR